MSEAPHPPPPVAKPGRTMVYRVFRDFVPREAKEFKLVENDIVYLRESNERDKYCEAKCVEKGTHGIFPKDCVEDHLELIKFPLHEAAKIGDFDFLRECLDNNVSVNGLDRSGSTALHWAAYAGHARIVHCLLSVPNVALSAQNKLGDSPLHAASSKGRLDCARLMIEAGANVQLRNRHGKRPIDVAANAEIGALLRTTMAQRGGDEDYLEEEEEDEDTTSMEGEQSAG